MQQQKSISMDAAQYVVHCRRPHYWLIGLCLLTSYILWTGDGVPLIPLGQQHQQEMGLSPQQSNVEKKYPHQHYVTSPIPTTNKIHSNFFLMGARCCNDVVAHGFPQGLYVRHKRFVTVPMSCDSCTCGAGCACGPGVKEISDPYTSGDFALAYVLLLLPLAGAVLLLSERRSLILTAAGLTITTGMLNRPAPPKSKEPSTAAPDESLKQVLDKLSGARQWADIASIKLTPDSQSTNLRECTVNLSFVDGTQANIKLRSLREIDLMSLLAGLERWGDAEKVAPEVLEILRSALAKDQPQPQSQEDTSFTSMWENDLSSHMGATTFVPLAKGAELQSGRFKIFALLSSGGLSAVYLAEQPNGPLVILKESVVPQHIDDKLKEKARELFEREAKLLLKLNHPQIARVIDHIVERRRDYLVLEYMPGQNLRQLVKRAGPQSEETVLKWTAEIASILEYLHGLEPPVVHRDLTPDNIVLREDGSIAVIDFGAANEYVGAATGTLIGKQSYIAPEQFRGKSTPLSDIYALGCTLNFLLTGEDPEPLSASHPKSIHAEISESLDTFVAALTSMNEQERISSAHEVKERVTSMMSQQSTERNDEDRPASPMS